MNAENLPQIIKISLNGVCAFGGMDLRINMRKLDLRDCQGKGVNVTKTSFAFVDIVG